MDCFLPGSSFPLFWQAVGQEVAEDLLVVLVRGDQVVVCVYVVAPGLHHDEEFLDGGGVLVGDEVGLHDDGGVVLEVDETVGPGEIEVDLLRIHEVEDRHVVFTVAKVLESVT